MSKDIETDYTKMKKDIATHAKDKAERLCRDFAAAFNDTLKAEKTLAGAAKSVCAVGVEDKRLATFMKHKVFVAAAKAHDEAVQKLDKARIEVKTFSAKAEDVVKVLKQLHARALKELKSCSGEAKAAMAKLESSISGDVSDLDVSAGRYGALRVDKVKYPKMKDKYVEDILKKIWTKEKEAANGTTMPDDLAQLPEHLKLLKDQQKLLKESCLSAVAQARAAGVKAASPHLKAAAEAHKAIKEISLTFKKAEAAHKKQIMMSKDKSKLVVALRTLQGAELPARQLLDEAGRSVKKLATA